MNATPSVFGIFVVGIVITGLCGYMVSDVIEQRELVALSIEEITQLQQENQILNDLAVGSVADSIEAQRRITSLEAQVAMLQQQNAELLAQLELQQNYDRRGGTPGFGQGGGSDLMPFAPGPLAVLHNLSLAQIAVLIFLTGLVLATALGSAWLFLSDHSGRTRSKVRMTREELDQFNRWFSPDGSY
jgi:hypothetical protein